MFGWLPVIQVCVVNVYNNLRSHAPRQFIRVDRRNVNFVNQKQYENTDSTNLNEIKRFYTQNLDAGSPGMALTNGATQAGMAVQMPHYNVNRMVSCNPGVLGKGQPLDDSDTDTYRLVLIFKGPGNAKAAEHTTVFRACETGQDFNFFNFRCVPATYSLNVVPGVAS